MDREGLPRFPTPEKIVAAHNLRGRGCDMYSLVDHVTLGDLPRCSIKRRLSPILGAEVFAGAACVLP